ncbi:MAG: hypothetical protein OEW12_05380 [Deltaproteobacteria bacterium]|nr:hypothetical protein [Deltaproteobacteria bacterium]
MAAKGEYEEGLKLIEETKKTYGGNNEVIYHLDRGMYAHLAGKYAESNQAFEQAERLMDELYTESITKHIGAFATNDSNLPYPGEDFEQVTVNIYRAINYASLGQMDEALVEARKVDNKLNVINQQYSAKDKNAYSEDAFARMLMATFYQAGGSQDDLNDAFISNRKAVAIYQKQYAPLYHVGPPGFLKNNYLATAGFMGGEELQQAKQLFPGNNSYNLSDLRNHGLVVFVHSAGKGPVKEEESFRAQMPDGNFFAVAFPRYVRRSSLITGARVVVDGNPAIALDPAAPIGDIAIQNLKNRIGRIRVKAIARATAKYIANRAIQSAARSDEEKALAFIVGNVATLATESADLRAWETLPDQILIGGVLLPPGKKHIVVEFTSGKQDVVTTRDLGDIEITPGKTRFISLHTIQ